MQLFHIPQCSIQNRNVHISVLNGALRDMEQVHSGICEIGLLNVNILLWLNVTHTTGCYAKFHDPFKKQFGYEQDEDVHHI